LIVVPALAFVVLLGSGLGRDPRALPSELVGESALVFTLLRLGGDGTVSRASLRGQVVVLNFWASWCLACREEHPDLLDAWERYRERGVVVGIDFEDTEAAVIAYAEEMGGDWPLVTDPGSAPRSPTVSSASRRRSSRAERHRHREERWSGHVSVANERDRRGAQDVGETGSVILENRPGAPCDMMPCGVDDGSSKLPTRGPGDPA
jgi:thiol-disulfide isomerase/thioredoxin